MVFGNWPPDEKKTQNTHFSIFVKLIIFIREKGYMRYKRSYLLALFILLLYIACQKKSDQNSSPKSTWTIDGKTYTEGTSPTRFSSSVLFASDNSSHGDISIKFLSKPTISGNFRIVNLSDTAVLRPGTDCSIEVNTNTNNISNIYKSTGRSGDNASIAVGANGKLTITLSNIEMADFSFNSKTLSGTIIEK